MELRPLGNTGAEIPAIGLGTSRYHGGIEPLRRGITLGAWIDTAEMYGTEGVVGEAVQGMRQQAFIATKVLPSHLSYAELLQAADNSLRRLRTDHIDLYQVHFPSSRVPIAETMSAMEELVTQGKVRFIGVSNFSVAQLREAQSTMTRYPIVSNQVRYSLTNRRIEADLLPYCQQHQVTVIAHTPLDRGGLISRPLLGRRPSLDILERVAKEAGKTPAQVAINWCVSRPYVVAIPKSDKVERVVENCNAAGWALTPAQFQTLDTAFQ